MIPPWKVLQITIDAHCNVLSRVDCYRKQCVIDEESSTLEILDIAEPEDQRYLLLTLRVPINQSLNSPAWTGHIERADGFLLVYAVNSRPSFQEIRELRERILCVKNLDQFPMLLVANKTDLTESQRQVSPQGISSPQTVGFTNKWCLEGRDLAESIGCQYIETSAKERHNVEEIFYRLVRLIRKERRERAEQERKARVSNSRSSHGARSSDGERKKCVIV